jgi:hypothetical protein
MISDDRGPQRAGVLGAAEGWGVGIWIKAAVPDDGWQRAPEVVTPEV